MDITLKQGIQRSALKCALNQSRHLGKAQLPRERKLWRAQENVKGSVDKKEKRKANYRN